MMANTDIDDMRDNLRRAARSDLARTVLTQEKDGCQFTIEVSPCSWMYAGYGVQIEVTMAGGGKVYVHDKTLSFEQATEADMVRLFQRVGVKRCRCAKCNRLAFDPSTVTTNRNGQCEQCFLAKLNEKFRKEQDCEQQRIAKLDARHKAKGYTHRVDAWVHAGGDDKPITVWMAGATDAKVRTLLKKEGCCVLNDYRITAL